jgi:UDP-N-acetylmuramoylalanine--D-glutamate ligase
MKGEEKLIPVSELKLIGQHNVANVLCALALGTAAGIDLKSMLSSLQTFKGLSHRCEWVANYQDIQWINDSKGTNVGATLAAVHGIGPGLKGKLVLILGGDGKGADFSDLIPVVRQYCRAVVVMGKDAMRLQATLKGVAKIYAVENMVEAVGIAKACAESGDVVLLSPACASTDQYRDYAERGKKFMDAVQGLRSHYANLRED